MPLVIPGSRNLSREAFTAFQLGLHRSRNREAERQRQEEAADTGGGGLGAGIGAVVGSFIPGVGPVVGAGIGQAAGTLIDPPGSRAGLSQEDQIGRGLLLAGQGIAQNIERERSTELSDNAKDEAFLGDMLSQYGRKGVQDFEKFSTTQLSANPDMSRSDLRQAFMIANADRFEQGRQDLITGTAAARQQAKVEADNLALYQRHRLNPSEVFEWNGILGETHNGFLVQEKLTGDELRTNQIDRGMAQAANTQRRLNEVEFARGLRRKAPVPTSVQQVRKAGKQLQQGQQYFDENVPGSVVSVSSGGAINTYVPPGTVIQDKANPNRRVSFDTKGKQVFHSRRRPDGVWYSPGMEFPIEGGTGLYQYDQDGEIKQVPGTGGDDDTVKNLLKLATDIAKARQGKVADAVTDAVDLQEQVEDALEEKSERAEEVQFNTLLKSADTADRFTAILSVGIPEFNDAMKVIRNVDKADHEQVITAAAQIRELLIPYLGQGPKRAGRTIELPVQLDRQVQQWVRDLSVLVRNKGLQNRTFTPGIAPLRHEGVQP